MKLQQAFADKMANMDVQHIRIKMVICPEEMEYVTELFRQSDWTLSEVGDPQELQDEISELYHWTLDVNQDQKEAIQYLVTGHVTTVWEEPPEQRRLVDGKKKLVLELTDDQETRIREVMEEENWNTDEIVRGYLEQDDTETEEAEGNKNAENIPRYIIVPPREGHQECDECFSQPCVMDESNRQGWWPKEPSVPQDDNNIHRRWLYKDFHTALYHRGVWGDERYLARKAAVTGGVKIRREVMPECVCRKVRFWYPNKDGVPYMGHKNQ